MSAPVSAGQRSAAEAALKRIGTDDELGSDRPLVSSTVRGISLDATEWPLIDRLRTVAQSFTVSPDCGQGEECKCCVRNVAVLEILTDAADFIEAGVRS